MYRPLLCFALFAVSGVGFAAERSFPVGNFDSLGVSTSADVIVTTGQPVSVVASGPEASLDRLLVIVEDGSLKIRTKPGTKWGWGGDKVRIAVSVPRLGQVGVSGSGNVSVDRVVAPAFTAGVSGSGDLRVAALMVDSANFSVSGSGFVEAAGTSPIVKASVAGSGDVKIGKLLARTLNASVAGSGGVDAHATDTAAISVAGSSDVRVSGGAKCTVSKSGSGSVNCGEFSVR